ncbi:MAG TPA: LuxR C-terminal-related transcriptional regulator [Polyangiaceae bacterium]
MYWQKLLNGELRYVGSSCDRSGCYGVLALRAPEEARRFRLNDRSSNILERALRGERQKAIAIDFGISDAAVANTLAQCRRKLGFTCRSAELPLAFVLLAQAAANGRDVRVSPGSAPDEVVVGFERLDTSRLRSLTRAEAEVISGLIQGLSQQEIARERKARWRTVVNQLATARRKLPVSGRVELVRFLSQLSQHEPKRAEALAPVHRAEAGVREALHTASRQVA